MAKTNNNLGPKKTIKKKMHRSVPTPRQRYQHQSMQQAGPDIPLVNMLPKPTQVLGKMWNGPVQRVPQPQPQQPKQQTTSKPAGNAEAPIIIEEDAAIIIDESSPTAMQGSPQQSSSSLGLTASSEWESAYWCRVQNRMYRGTSKERKVLVIGADPLYLYGSFRVQCIFGTAQLNGVLLEADNMSDDRWDDACFPYNMEMPGIIENIGRETSTKPPNMQRLHWRLKDFAFDPKDVESKYSPGDAVVLIEGRLELHTFSAFCQCVGYYSLLPVITTVGKVVTTFSISKRKLNPLYSGAIESTIKQWLEHTQNSNNSGGQKITAVIGNKGVGKSSLVRYLANLKRNTHPDHVYILDLDMGQPLFSPPGCIGLYKVKHALLGASFAMQHNELDNALYIGSIEMSKIYLPDYARLISHLLKIFRKLGAGYHLLVNTAGWVEEFGAHFIHTMMDVVQPDFTFNLKSSRFPNYTLRDDDLNRVGSVVYQPMVDRNLGDIFRDNRLPPISASQARALQCTAYMMALGNVFATMRPYQVGFSRITLHLSLGTMRLADNMYLGAFNQVFVALCVTDQSTNRRLMDNENMPYRTRGEGEQPAEIYRCIGYGIIRAIDVEKKLFYVLTPIAAKKLKEVNMFARCEDINLSQKFMACQVNHDAPYWIWTKAVMGRSRSEQDKDVIAHLYNKVEFVTMKKRYFKHTKRAQLDD